VTYSHLEVIPKSLAASVEDMTFTPSTYEVIETDPVVRFDLELAANESTQIRYTVPLDPGPITQERLARLAADRATAASEYAAEVGGELAEKVTTAARRRSA
jgi:hypothetical protein